MNVEKLNEIKERTEKATSGPWEADLSRVYYGEENDELVCEIWKSFDDATFIAHAREDVPALVAEVERLNAEISDREDSHIKLYNDYQRVVDALRTTCYTLGADIRDYYVEGDSDD